MAILAAGLAEDHMRASHGNGLVRAGYRVVAWREPGLMHALVGNLPEATLVALARLCIQKATALLGARWWFARTMA